MWGVLRGIILCPSVKYGCHCANQHETDNHPVTFVDTSCTDFYPAWMKNVETYGQNFIYSPKQSTAFIPPIFRKLTISQYTGAFIYQSSLKSVKKYVQLGKNSLMPISMTVILMIFMKLTLAWPTLIQNPATEFYENPMYSFITDTRSQMDVAPFMYCM
jgi:hypothetical protein